MPSFPSNVSPGNFLRSTVDITSLDPTSQEYRVRIYQIFNQIILAINQKTDGLYQKQEILNGELFFPDPALNSTTSLTPQQRPVFRTTIDFGALPNNAEKPVAHTISFDSTFTITHLYAATTNQTGLSYRPIPYVSDDATELITLRADGTNVYIKTFKDQTAFTRTFVVIEFLKN